MFGAKLQSVCRSIGAKITAARLFDSHGMHGLEGRQERAVRAKTPSDR